VCKIFGGVSSTIMVMCNGKVYVWGYNIGGGLGLGDTNNRLTPVENANLESLPLDSIVDESELWFPNSVSTNIISVL